MAFQAPSLHLIRQKSDGRLKCLLSVQIFRAKTQNLFACVGLLMSNPSAHLTNVAAISPLQLVSSLTNRRTHLIRIDLQKILYIITASKSYFQNTWTCQPTLQYYPSVASGEASIGLCLRDYSGFKAAKGAQPCGYHLAKPKTFPMQYF